MSKFGENLWNGERDAWLRNWRKWKRTVSKLKRSNRTRRPVTAQMQKETLTAATIKFRSAPSATLFLSRSPNQNEESWMNPEDCRLLNLIKLQIQHHTLASVPTAACAVTATSTVFRCVSTAESGDVTNGNVTTALGSRPH